MIIHKIDPSVDYNKWLKCLDTKLNKQNNQNLKLWGLVYWTAQCPLPSLNLYPITVTIDEGFCWNK